MSSPVDFLEEQCIGQVDFYPLLRGGVGVPIKEMDRYLRLGTPGEVKRLLKQASDLPAEPYLR